MFPSGTLAWTTFFKWADVITVWTSDYIDNDTYFIWESKNVKQRIKMCKRWNSSDAPNGARLTLDPHVNSSSFAIVSGGQIVPFPMPRYENKQTVNPSGDMIPRAYNEIKWTDISASSPDGDMVLEANWTTLEGAPKQKKLTGQAEITSFYKTVTDLVRTLPASNVPLYIDTLFPGERILLTKSNIRVMQTDLERLIKVWLEKQKGSASPEEPPTPEKPTDIPDKESPKSFVGNGPQGQASFDFSKNGGSFTIKNGVDEFHTKWGRRSMYQVNAAAGMAGKIGGQSGLTTLPTPAAAKLMDFTKPSRVVSEGDVVVFRNVQGKFVAVKLMNIEDSVHGGSQDRLTIRWKVLQP